MAIFDEKTWEMRQVLGRFGKCRVLGRPPSQHQPTVKHTSNPENLTISDLCVTPLNRRSPVLKNVNFNLSPGNIVMLCGQSGSGKTTLLKALNGLIPWFDPYHIEGTVHLGGTPIDDLDPGQRSHLMGTCLDRPENQLFLPKARDEIEHASNRYQASATLIEMLISRFNIGPLLDRRTAELSSGERQRVALVTTMLAGHRPVLLDEPTAHLDNHGVEALVQTTADLAGQDSSFLIAEHATWRWNHVATAHVQLRGSCLHTHKKTLQKPLPKPLHMPGRKVVLDITKLCAGRNGKSVIGPIDLNLHEGEIIALSGQNGAGKSTFARTLAGWLKPVSGKITTTDRRRPALMLSEAELQLFSRTVKGELQQQCESMAELARVLRRHRVEHLAARPPWRLSRGEQQRLVHAVYDLQQPSVLIIDEPAQGLGSKDLKTLVNLIHRRAEKGRAYLIITHRSDLVATAHRYLSLENGQIQEVSP